MPSHVGSFWQHVDLAVGASAGSALNRDRDWSDGFLRDLVACLARHSSSLSRATGDRPIDSRGGYGTRVIVSPGSILDFETGSKEQFQYFALQVCTLVSAENFCDSRYRLSRPAWL